MKKKPMTWPEFAHRLLPLWKEACGRWETGEDSPPPAFAAWSGATKDVLFGLNMSWNGERYVLPPPMTLGQRVAHFINSIVAHVLGKIGDTIECIYPSKED